MNVAVVGSGFLADAIREVSPHPVADPDKANIVWVAHDTSVGANYDLDRVFRSYGQGLHVITCPVPVGTWGRLRHQFPQTRFAICPENIRRKTAAEDFRSQPFVIAGVEDEWSRGQVERLYEPFTDDILVMSPVSAELTKHAINGFLALSVGYIKRLSRVAGDLGANIDDVSRGLRSDPRIGHRAYLGPHGEPGDHLLRDVRVLRRLGCS